MVNVPTGGKKKKLKSAVAANAVNKAIRKPQYADVSRARTRKVRATVVGFTGRNRRYPIVIIPSTTTTAEVRAIAVLTLISVGIVLFT